ncbi:MAG: hypothetical protein ACFFCE_05805 [Promethearchaeota archaeon]
MPKKTRRDYDYYNLNIPNELRILFEAYLLHHPNLGFKSVSQYLLHVLQNKAEDLIKENPELKKIDNIQISNVIYKLQENGTYEKVADKEKLLDKIDELWYDDKK